MKIWQMPDGVYEFSGKRATELESYRRVLVDFYTDNGYNLVIPPIINFASHSSSFKFSDSSSNKTLELVSDITKQVAIIDAKNNIANINSYCYCNQIVKPFADDFYSSRTPMQTGCEVYGDDDISADYQVIKTMANSLNLLHLKNITITISNIAIFDLAINALGLRSIKKELTQILYRRSTPDAVDFIHNNSISCATEIMALVEGSIDEIITLFKNYQEVIAEIDKVVSLVNKLQDSGVSAILDLTDNQAYNYHKNLVFCAYSDGFSKAIARGGRYDKLLSARSATGFSFDLNFIINNK